MIFQPQLVSLDTATWGQLTSDRSPNEKRIFTVLNSGAIIPFFTETHFTELFQHGSDKVVETRLQMLRQLKFVSYLRDHDGSEVGGLLDLREKEMAILRDNPKLPAEQIVAKIKPQIINGFSTGAELCAKNEEHWKLFRVIGRDLTARSAEAVSLAQFPLPGTNLRQRIPINSNGLKKQTKEEMIRYFAERYEWLVNKLETDGDQRMLNLKPREQIASEFLKECYEDMLPLLDKKGDFLDNLLTQCGVNRSHLPKNPTIEDVTYEVTFQSHFKIHERRLGLPEGSLKQFVQQPHVPSWIVWREIDRVSKYLKKAEGSSFNDKMMLPFALYVDAFETDKRVYDCAIRAKNSHPLMNTVHLRVFKRGNLGMLAEKLEFMARENPSKTN